MDYQTFASKYLVRTYGSEKGAIMLQTDMLSDMDRKIIRSMTKLAMSYTGYKDKKVRTIQLDYRPVLAILNPPPAAPLPMKPVPCACKAIKMNGDKCTAKVKKGAFCARHSKK